MSTGGWTDALARQRPRAAHGLRDDEREFAPALRAIERSRRLAPQLRLLGRVHGALGGFALGLAALGSALGAGAVWFAPTAPPLALAAGSALLAGLAALAAGWLALGFGLRRRRPWARALGLACAVLLLPFAPLGTALGLWTGVVLLAWQPRLAQVAETP